MKNRKESKDEITKSTIGNISKELNTKTLYDFVSRIGSGVVVLNDGVGMITVDKIREVHDSLNRRFGYIKIESICVEYINPDQNIIRITTKFANETTEPISKKDEGTKYDKSLGAAKRAAINLAKEFNKENLLDFVTTYGHGYLRVNSDYEELTKKEIIWVIKRANEILNGITIKDIKVGYYNNSSISDVSITLVVEKNGIEYTYDKFTMFRDGVEGTIELGIPHCSLFENTASQTKQPKKEDLLIKMGNAPGPLFNHVYGIGNERQMNFEEANQRTFVKRLEFDKFTQDITSMTEIEKSIARLVAAINNGLVLFKDNSNRDNVMINIVQFQTELKELLDLTTVDGRVTELTESNHVETDIENMKTRMINSAKNLAKSFNADTLLKFVISNGHGTLINSEYKKLTQDDIEWVIEHANQHIDKIQISDIIISRKTSRLHMPTSNVSIELIVHDEKGESYGLDTTNRFNEGVPVDLVNGVKYSNFITGDVELKKHLVDYDFVLDILVAFNEGFITQQACTIMMDFDTIKEEIDHVINSEIEDKGKIIKTILTKYYSDIKCSQNGLCLKANKRILSAIILVLFMENYVSEKINISRTSTLYLFKVSKCYIKDVDKFTQLLLNENSKYFTDLVHLSTAIEMFEQDDKLIELKIKTL